MDGSRVLPFDNGRRWSLLVFWSARCTPCSDVVETLATAANAALGLSVVVVSRGTQDEHHALSELLGPNVPIVPQVGRSISQQYQTFDAPAAYLIDSAGRIAEPVARGRAAVERVIQKAVSRAGVTSP
jgi:hypothetical protein